MAKSKWEFLLATQILSAISVVIIIVSFSTDYWVIAEAKHNTNDPTTTIKNSQISYGLFDGKLTRNVNQGSDNYELRIVCKFGSNKCYYSCQQSSTKRNEEFEALLNGEKFTEQCSPIAPKKTARVFDVQVYEGEQTTGTFLSAGLWLTTVIFMSLSCVLALISGIFSMINIIFDPYRMLTSPFGLYIWNGIAAGLVLLTMIFWLSLHLIFITNNIAIADTLGVDGIYSSDGMATLGFSYWILFVPIFSHLINIAIVYYRFYLIHAEPKKSDLRDPGDDNPRIIYN